MTVRTGRSEYDIDTLVLLSEMYYIQGRTQKDISDQLGLSRPAVSRLLQAARDEGIVNITIVDPSKRLKDMEERLVEAFGLVGCRLSPAGRPDMLKARMGSRAANMLMGLLRPGDVVGFGAGSTVYEAVMALPCTREYPGLRVVPLSGGGLGIDGAPQINQVVHTASERLNGEPVYLNAPLYVGEPRVARLLMEDRSITQCTRLWDQLGCAVIGLGQGNLTDTRDPYFAAALADVDGQNVAAAVCGWFLDMQGKRLIGGCPTSVSSEQLSRARHVMAVAGGKQKAKAILAAMRSGFVTHLVADEDAAREVLFMHDALNGQGK